MKNALNVLSVRLVRIVAIFAIIGFLTACGGGDDTSTQHEHQWGNWTVTTAATCSATGTGSRVCTVCGETDTNTTIPIDQNAHDYHFIEGSGTAPTCTQEGNGNEVCSYNASHTRSGVLPIDPTAHDWEQFEGTAPTCTADGSGKRKCKLCREEESGVLAKLEHNYQWQVTTASTFTSGGTETEICSHNSTHTRNTRTIDPLPITTAADWNNAVTAIQSVGNNKTYEINVTGNFSIPSSSPTFVASGITVNIRGTGTITLATGSTGSLLYIDLNQTVSLKDTHLVGHSANNTSLVYVRGTFNMTGGTISGNTNTNTGTSSFDNNSGGVYVDVGTFTMTGGTISGNTASYGGGVIVKSGTFNMSGGIISDNTATGTSTYNNGGGGVYVNGDGSTFTMSGTAEISGNKAVNGGGIYLSGNSDGTRTFNMTGGTISGNTSTSTSGNSGGGGIYTATGNGSFGSQRIIINMTGGTISGNSTSDANGTMGGGVYVSSSKTTFTMSGGTISNNNAFAGGGVNIDASLTETTFTMTGGNITGNSASSLGGGVMVQGGTSFNLKSLDLITNNSAVSTTPAPSNNVMCSGTLLINESTPPDSLKVVTGLYAW